MAEAVVSVVLQTLRSLVLEKARLLSGVTDQVEEISRELKRMQLFLKDADSRTHDNESVRNWLREIRILAYKVEDIVETFAAEIASNRRRGLKKIIRRFACIACEAKSLHSLGMEIAKAKRDISNITTCLQRYDIKAVGEGRSSSAGNEHQWWGRQTYAHQLEENFVGMEEDMKTLVSLVVDDDKRHRVISIWGMGGLGKTTLARRIYKHKDVQRHFGRFAWACITQHGQIRNILQDVLVQIAPETTAEVKGMGDRELVRQLHLVQQGRKSLVVLDDIWKADDWKSLVAAFPIAEGGCKILLTTRDRKIAEIGFPYAPKFLTEKESWELLQRIAFSQNNLEDHKIERKLEDVGKEMACKCGGLPLAISVLGGILKDKNSLAEWKMVNEYVSSYLSKPKDDPDGGVVAQVLSLSYRDLPYYLKPCFLYLASFKEDEEIDAGRLYQLWMAEGMVLLQHQRNEETLVEVAERYLDELVCRSVVQVRLLEFPIARKHLSCSLHDMMKDLCMEKAREEEFIRVLEFQPDGKPLLEPSISTYFSSRLVLRMDDKSVKAAAKAATSLLENNLQVRSLLCFGKKEQKEIIWPEGMINLKCTRSLRTLHFEGFEFQNNKLPVEIPKMIHLRYLSVKNCKLEELPSSIAELPFLHALQIQVNNKIEVPNVLCKMKQLRHLHIVDSDHYTKNGKLRLHGLLELERLIGLDSRTDEVSDIANLSNLRSLIATICDENSLHFIIDHINKNALKLKSAGLCIEGFDLVGPEEESGLLTKVLTSGGNLHGLAISVEMRKFPKYEPQMLQNLGVLYMENSKIQEDPMEVLEMVPHLQMLTLGKDAYIGKEMASHAFGFPKLRKLHLFELSNLERWWIEKDALPKLWALVIWGCQKLEMIPDGLKFVLSLERLSVFDMPGKFCERIKDVDDREGDDYYKIRHVPSVLVSRPTEFLIGSVLPNLRKLRTIPDN